MSEELLRWIHFESASAEQAGILLEYNKRRELCWNPEPIRATHDGQPVAAAYFTCLPGDLAMLGGVRSVSGAEELAVNLLRQQIQSVQTRLPSAHIQAAISDGDLQSQQLVQRAGFRSLTAVDQLWISLVDDRMTHAASSTNSLSPDLQWRSAVELSRSRFVQLIAGTFDGTLDCPELNNIRTNDQVVDSFLMNRAFRRCPHWYILFHRDRPVGCLLLLAHNRELVELVYMGLVPAARGQRLGFQLIQQAKRAAVELGATMLVLAADVRNAPALKTYLQSGFQRHRRLQVYWHQ